MGGKNAIIVDADADLDDAVPAIVQSAFGYAGQKCSAASRLVVVDDDLRRARRTARGRDRARPDRPSSRSGHRRRPPHRRAGVRTRPRLSRLRGNGRPRARATHRRLRYGLVRGPDVGRARRRPLTRRDRRDLRPGARTAPRPRLRPRDRDRQRHRLRAHRRLLLAHAIPPRAAGTELRAGNVYLNRAITGAVVGRQPFGGFGLSGVGSKAGGPDYLHQFVEPRSISENTLRQGFAPE